MYLLRMDGTLGQLLYIMLHSACTIRRQKIDILLTTSHSQQFYDDRNIENPG